MEARTTLLLALLGGMLGAICWQLVIGLIAFVGGAVVKAVERSRRIQTARSRVVRGPIRRLGLLAAVGALTGCAAMFEDKQWMADAQPWHDATRTRSLLP